MSRFVENRKKTPTRGPPSTPPRHTYIVHRQDQSAVSLSMIDRWGKVQLINKRYLNVDTVCNTVRGHALRDFSLVGGNRKSIVCGVDAKSYMNTSCGLSCFIAQIAFSLTTFGQRLPIRPAVINPNRLSPNFKTLATFDAKLVFLTFHPWYCGLREIGMRASRVLADR